MIGRLLARLGAKLKRGGAAVAAFICKEPVAFYTGAATAVMDTLVGFGVAVPDGERSQIVGAITTLYLLTTLLARRKVSPTK